MLVIESLLSVFSKIFAVVLVEISSLNFILLIIPTVIMFILRIRMYVMDKDDTECFSLINFVIVLFV